MKRFTLFLVLLVVAVSAFLLILTLYATMIGNESMYGMMSQVVGATSNSGVSVFSTMPFYMWASLATLGSIAIVGIFGLAYYLAFPQIKSSGASEASRLPPSAKPNDGSWSTLLRASKPEERKLLELLSSHDGSYLQKLLVNESGLSKLKVHRIIARLAERNIIIVKKSGNTNEIKISDWIQQNQ